MVAHPYIVFVALYVLHRRINNIEFTFTLMLTIINIGNAVVHVAICSYQTPR